MTSVLQLWKHGSIIRTCLVACLNQRRNDYFDKKKASLLSSLIHVAYIVHYMVASCIRLLRSFVLWFTNL